MLRTNKFIIFVWTLLSPYHPITILTLFGLEATLPERHSGIVMKYLGREEKRSPEQLQFVLGTWEYIQLNSKALYTLYTNANTFCVNLHETSLRIGLIFWGVQFLHMTSAPYPSSSFVLLPIQGSIAWQGSLHFLHLCEPLYSCLQTQQIRLTSSSEKVFKKIKVLCICLQCKTSRNQQEHRHRRQGARGL